MSCPVLHGVLPRTPSPAQCPTATAQPSASSPYPVTAAVWNVPPLLIELRCPCTEGAEPPAEGRQTEGPWRCREELRLKNRVLDLRRPSMASNLRTRHKIVQCLRRRLEDNHGFLEVETPVLTRSTPEGARDYVVRPPTCPPAVHRRCLPRGWNRSCAAAAAASSARSACTATAYTRPMLISRPPPAHTWHSLMICCRCISRACLLGTRR